MLVLFLILTFGGGNFQNSQAMPLFAATRTNQELIIGGHGYFKGERGFEFLKLGGE